MSKYGVPGHRTTPTKVRCRREEYRPDEIPTRDHNSQRQKRSNDRNTLANAHARRSFPFSNQTSMRTRVLPRSHSEGRCVARKQTPLRSSRRRFSASAERRHDRSIPNRTRNNSAIFSSEYLPSNTSSSNPLAKHIFYFWKHGRLCDVILHAGGKSFHAHKLVLAASCKHFANLREDGTELVEFEIPGASSSGVHDALLFFYTSNIDVSDENVEDLLHIAQTLGSEQLKNICAQYLGLVSLSNAFAKRKIARRFGLSDVVNEIDNYMRSNAESLIQTEVFLNSEFKQMYEIMSANILTNLNDLQNFHACARWIAHDQLERTIYAPALMELVRFTHISPQDIVTQCEPVAFIFENPECKNMLFYAFRHHALNSHTTDSAPYDFKRQDYQSEKNDTHFPEQNIELSPFPTPGADYGGDGNEVTEKVVQDTSVSFSKKSSASEPVSKSSKSSSSTTSSESSSTTSSENLETDNLESSKNTEETMQQLKEERMDRVRSYVGNVPVDASDVDGQAIAARRSSANNVASIVSKLSGISVNTLLKNKVSKKDFASYSDFKNESKENVQIQPVRNHGYQDAQATNSRHGLDLQTHELQQRSQHRAVDLSQFEPEQSGTKIHERPTDSDQDYHGAQAPYGSRHGLDRQTHDYQRQSQHSVAQLSTIPSKMAQSRNSIHKVSSKDSEQKTVEAGKKWSVDKRISDGGNLQRRSRRDSYVSAVQENEDMQPVRDHGYQDAQAPNSRQRLDLQTNEFQQRSQHRAVDLSPIPFEPEQSVTRIHERPSDSDQVYHGDQLTHESRHGLDLQTHDYQRQSQHGVQLSTVPSEQNRRSIHKAPSRDSQYSEQRTVEGGKKWARDKWRSAVSSRASEQKTVDGRTKWAEDKWRFATRKVNRLPHMGIFRFAVKENEQIQPERYRSRSADHGYQDVQMPKSRQRLDLQTHELQQRSQHRAVDDSPIPFETDQSGTKIQERPTESDQGYHGAQAPNGSRHGLDRQAHDYQRQSQHGVVQLSTIPSETAQARNSIHKVSSRDSEQKTVEAGKKWSVDKRISEGGNLHRRSRRDSYLSDVQENEDIQPVRDHGYQDAQAPYSRQRLDLQTHEVQQQSQHRAVDLSPIPFEAEQSATKLQERPTDSDHGYQDAQAPNDSRHGLDLQTHDYQRQSQHGVDQPSPIPYETGQSRNSIHKVNLSSRISEQKILEGRNVDRRSRMDISPSAVQEHVQIQPVRDHGYQNTQDTEAPYSRQRLDLQTHELQQPSRQSVVKFSPIPFEPEQSRTKIHERPTDSDQSYHGDQATPESRHGLDLQTHDYQRQSRHSVVQLSTIPSVTAQSRNSIHKVSSRASEQKTGEGGKKLAVDKRISEGGNLQRRSRRDSYLPAVQENEQIQPVREHSYQDAQAPNSRQHLDLQTHELQQRSQHRAVDVSPIPFETDQSGTKIHERPTDSDQGYHGAQAPYVSRHGLDLQTHDYQRQSQHGVAQLSPIPYETGHSRSSMHKVSSRDSQYTDKWRSAERNPNRRSTLNICPSAIEERVQIQPVREGCNIPRKSSINLTSAAHISSHRMSDPGPARSIHNSTTGFHRHDTNESAGDHCRSRRIKSSSSLDSNCTIHLSDVSTTPPPPPPLPAFPVVIVTGVSNRNVPMSLYQFDPHENNWSNLKQLPLQVQYAAVSCLNGKIYVTGGRINSSFSDSPVKECNVYNMLSGLWTRMTSMKTARAHHASVTLNGQLYVIGGEDCVMMSLKNVEMYDANTATWTTIAPLRDARVGAAAAAHRGRIFVAGGMLDTDARFLLDSFEVYDPRCKAWSHRSPLPTALCDASLADVDGVLYLVGGYVIKDKRRLSQSSVYRYCDETDAWQEVFTMSVPRHRAVVVAIDARMLVIGGESADPGSYDRLLTSVVGININGQCEAATNTSLPEALVGLAGCVMHGL